VSTGSATITATSEGQSGSATVVVIGFISEPDVTVSPAETTLVVGAKAKLSAKVKGDKKPKLTWRTSNSSVARVGDDGTVTARDEGTATITAETSDGRRGSAKVTVKNR
jgi:uncharacterized protein YjdB